VGTAPISGSNNLARLDLAIQALEVRLERYEWFEIYSASGQQQIR
jgi:predicted oxidoreductase